MNFEVSNKAFKKALSPVFAISEKCFEKEYKYARAITINVSKIAITTIADGGISKIKNTFNEESYEDLKLKINSTGSVTIYGKELFMAIDSFDKDDVLTISLEDNKDGSYVKITSSIKPDEFQSIPCLPISIKTFDLEFAKKDAEYIIVPRDEFVYSSNRLVFAHGLAESLMSGMLKNWCMKKSGDVVMFSAGNGPRFVTIEKKDIVIESSGDIEILLPNNQTSSIVETLSHQGCKNIRITKTATHIIFDCDCVELVVNKPNLSESWPDVHKFVNRDSKFKSVIKITDLDMANKGIQATNTGDVSKIGNTHIASIKIDSAAKQIVLKSEQYLKSFRKIDAIDVYAPTDIEISVTSKYITEITKQGYGKNYFQIEIEDRASPVVCRLNSGDKLAKAEDLFLTDAGSDFKERMTIFFKPLV